MKINSRLKYLLIVTSVFCSLLVFGLVSFYAPEIFTFWVADHGLSTINSPDSTYSSKPPAPDSLYSAALKACDKYFLERNYDQCLRELEKAEKLKPKDQSLIERILKMKSLIAETKQKQQDAAKSIASGDTYFNAKDYINAKASYQMAVGLTPDDAVAKEKLSKIMSLLRSQKASNTLYDVAVASADKLYQQKEYAKAQVEYENASRILPADPYAKNKINELIKIQVDMQVKEESYTRYIASADKSYAAKNLQAALADYKNAGTLKPEEKYPQDRIKELTTLLAAQKAKNDAYNKLIALADQAFTDALYVEAVKGYQDALVIKPEEVYPKSRIKEIEGIVARALKAGEEYEKYIALADSFYIDKNYMKARDNYLIASSVKPRESYPKEMLLKAEKMLPAQEAAIASAMASAKSLDEQYSALLTSADKQLTEKAFEPAKADYKKALALKPGETYPKTKIAEIDRVIQALALQKSSEERYSVAIRSGDSLFALKSYAPALAEFQNALKLKPAETYPKSKITEINQALADLAKQKTLEDQYSTLIASGDKSLADKRYEIARTVFQNAGKLKPDEQYPKDKVAEIGVIIDGLANQKVVDDRYKATITSADKLLLAKSLDQARAEYVNAGNIKPGEQYPKDKILEVDKIIEGIAAKKALDEQTELARQKSIEEQYTLAIADGDRLLSEKSYAEAKLKFQEALKVKPAEQYPKTKIAEADAALAELAKLKSIDDQYKASVANADNLLAAKKYELARNGYLDAGKIKPSEQYLRDKVAEIALILEGIANQKAVDERYKSSIAAADKLLLAKSLEQARGEYVNAGNIKPDELYPKDKVAEIDRLLGEIAAKKGLDEQYNQALATADKLLTERNFDQAKQSYQNASGLKPAEIYPKTRIAEIDKALNDIARQKALDEQYSRTIDDGDKLLAAKSYADAKVQFQEALKAKPEEVYPKQKITEIESTLAEIARQKAIDNQYGGIITKADALLAAKSYLEAKDEYNNALKVKPAESYPKDKTAEIDKILAETAAKKKALDDSYKASIAKADQLFAAKTYDLARNEYLNAGVLKPDEQYPKVKAGQVDSVLALIARKKALDDEYSNTVSDADKLLAARSFEEAKAAYLKAGELKPAEQYPKLKVAEAEKGIAEVSRKKAIDDQYASTIINADKLLGEKSYDLAKSAYLEAGKIKPAEQYPKDKIAEITSVLATLAKQKAIDDQYKLTISKADQLLLAKSYPQARIEFQNALKIKPDEQYPKDKTGEIDALLAEQKARDDQYKAFIVKADQLLLGKQFEEARTEYQNAGQIKPELSYPNDKIAEINKALTELKGKRQTFDDLVANADGQLQQKEWGRAKDLYRQALVIFPEESYPKSRIALVDSKIDSLYRANKSRYDKAVADGDRFFSTFEFDKAVDSFTEAMNLLPMENYPKEMIAKIRRTISENAIVDVFNSTVTIAAGTEKQFPFTPVNMASRKDNFVYIKIRNLSNKPFNVLMRYGKDKQANGGVVIRNLSLDGKVNERLVSVRDQDAWYREENNWISLYPQGGDIEVSFIQVSRAK